MERRVRPCDRVAGNHVRRAEGARYTKMIISRPELMEFVSANCVTRKGGARPTVDLVSIGLHLSDEFIKYKTQAGFVELPSTLETESVSLKPDRYVDFPPGSCLLA